MTNFEHFMFAYKHIRFMSMPRDKGRLHSLLTMLKANADSIFDMLLLSVEDCAPRVPRNAVRRPRK